MQVQTEQKPEAIEKAEYVEVKVLLPKQLLELLRNLHVFAKYPESFEEYLGYHITASFQADFNNSLEGVFNLREIYEGYGLDKVPSLNIDHNVLDDC